MRMHQLLDQCRAVPLVLEDLPLMDQQALDFFCNPDLVSDPFVDASFTHDITKARACFDALKQDVPDATFTAFLTWCIVKSLSSVAHANYRKVDGKWYDLKSPPFFMPVTTGLEPRLAGIVLMGVAEMDFAAFSEYYNREIARARRGEIAPYAPVQEFLLSHNLVNLPNFRFNSIKPQATREKSTHVWWIMGQRHEKDGALLVPMTIRMHHANGDSVIFARVLEQFGSYCSNPIL